MGVTAHADETSKDTPPAEVVVRRAAEKCFTSLVHASGYLVPRATAVVMLNAPGYRITEVRAKAGDTVKRGDVVARAAPITPEKPGAPGDVDIRSLVAGTVLASTAVVGMPTSEKAPPLFTIAVDGTIEAAVAVPSVHILELAIGQAARVTMRDGGVQAAKVRRTPASVDPASQMGTARLSIDTAGKLEPSSFVLATIEARRSCGVGVPTAALRRTSAGTYVQVIADDVIARRAVTVDLADDADSEVATGLAAGDVVVVGPDASREGDRVTPVYADPRDAP